MSKRLAGKIAMITGAGSGIGLATAERFSQAGAAVVLADIDFESVEQIAAQLQRKGYQALAVAADVSRSQDVQTAIAAAVMKFGSLDILFANAGIGSSAAPLSVSDEHWDQVMGVNAKGVFFCCREAVRQMLAQKPPGGAIVINASISALAGIPGQGAYAPSKGAVLQMTRQFAVEYASQNIRVNCVCPGTVDTPVLRRAMQESGDGDALLAMLLEGHPIGRIGRPEEIAAAVEFLASDDASFITGAILPVDGGYTAR